MNSETYATDYTLEEQAANLWQSAPAVLHLKMRRTDPRNPGHTFRAKGKPAENGDTFGREAMPVDMLLDKPETAKGVRYVRSDLFDAKAAELETALKHAHGLHTDLAKLDEQRAPQFAYLIVKRGAHGGVPVGFQLSEDAAWLMAELYSADEGGREYDVRKLPLATAALAVKP